MQVELTEGTLFRTSGVPFRAFAMLGGDLTGTTEDGRLLKVEMIHRTGSETHIHYYEDGQLHTAVRHSGRTPSPTRTF